MDRLETLYRSFHDMRRQLPEWFAPLAYGLAVFAVVVSSIAMLTTIGGAPSPHSVTPQAEKRQVAARAPIDTPESAPELSPVYPTLVYGNTASTGQAELARRLAREGRVTQREPESERSTDGYSPRGNFFWGGGPKR